MLLKSMDQLELLYVLLVCNCEHPQFVCNMTYRTLASAWANVLTLIATFVNDLRFRLRHSRLRFLLTTAIVWMDSLTHCRVAKYMTIFLLLVVVIHIIRVLRMMTKINLLLFVLYVCKGEHSSVDPRQFNAIMLLTN